MRGFAIRTLSIFIIGLAVTAGLAIGPTDVAAAREIVETGDDYGYGTIVIKTSEKRLYYSLGDGKAIRYSVAVGSPRNQWFGSTWVSEKKEHPGWTPTPSMRSRNPRLPKYVAPGPNNPLGVRALYLGWTAYRIHGTNAPGSIGQAVSNGCIRMLNEDVVDLFERVHIGAPVMVLR
ncbi:L,D-transpeptidase [Microbaculum marinum]|uniref:L,D-transpeptidase n=1 Tax=Microbaculum marinum TaxID=1764581 RepID=A0AAW9RY47_9HYPH